MTFIKDFDSHLAGITLLLQSTNAATAIPLTEWLPIPIPFAVIPLGTNINLTKLFVALSTPEYYSKVLQEICLQISKSTVVEWQGKIYEISGVEVDKDELHILQIPIYTSEIIAHTSGKAIHAKCFYWLHLADASLAERLHEQEVLPLSLAIKPVTAGKRMYLRIGLLQKELLAPLLYGLSQELSKKVVLAGTYCRLGRCVEIVQSSRFEVLAQIPAEDTLELEFLSPTSFKQSQVIQPFPLPELVFNGLWRRWNEFAPVQLQFPAVDWRLMTSAYELKTKVFKLKVDAEIGAIGWVRYRFPEHQAQIATTLANFASFAGVGRKTAMGMGQVKVLS